MPRRPIRTPGVGTLTVSELSSLSALWQQADVWALQRLDALWSLEAGAMGLLLVVIEREFRE